ncbi:MAG: hypothetical protein U0871_04970 [Gemmataceae bacterium]
MKRILSVAVVVAGVAFASGCSDTKNSDPKPASGKTNPKLQPAGTGSGATPQGAVKGD